MNSKEKYNLWLNSGQLTENEKRELESLDSNDIDIRFGSELSFGTAGIRGIMGMGTGMFNRFVVRRATQVFADILRRDSVSAKAAVCYDCRHGSRDFAKAAAEVFAGNGVKVYFFRNMRPTPELSFAIIKMGLSGGVNITASHNPKEYNGFKVYMASGAQLTSSAAEEVAGEIEKTDIFTGIKSQDFDRAVSSGMIEYLDEQTDREFIDDVMKCSCKEEIPENMSVVYTPFHGTGGYIIPRILSMCGVKRLHCVQEQMQPDGNFPTVQSPNPEEPEGFSTAVKLAEKVRADMIIGSDPDADRIAVLVRHNGEYVPLTGNQTGVLLLDYLIQKRKQLGITSDNTAFIKSIVTTDLAKAVAEDSGVMCTESFTGFKYMAQTRAELERQGINTIMAYEESIGYMIGPHVADKDAVTAAMLLTQMCAMYLKNSMTPVDRLDSLYRKFGFYGENTVSIYMSGADGKRRMDSVMHELRYEPPAEIKAVPVKCVHDYLTGRNTELAGSDVLCFELNDSTKIFIRPSGTEPKIKIYIMVVGTDSADRTAKLELFTKWAEEIQ